MRPVLIFSIQLIFVFISTHSAAQWQWGIGGTNSGSYFEGMSLKTDNFGNFYYTGYIMRDTAVGRLRSTYGTITLIDSVGDNQLVLVKADAAGDIKWVKGAQGGNTEAKSVTTDAAGNVYVLGIYDTVCRFGTHTVTSSIGPWMYFITKLDSAGNVLWMQNIGEGWGLDQMNSGGLSIDDSGYIYAAGNFRTSSVTIGSYTITNAGLSDLFIVKYAPSGSVVWAKRAGGTDLDYALGIAAGPNGDVYVSGRFATPGFTFAGTTVAPTHYYMGLLKFDRNGNEKWLHGGNCLVNDIVYGMTTDKQDNVYLTGAFVGDTMVLGFDTLIRTSITSAFMLKIDSSGNSVWKHVPTGVSTGSDMAAGVSVDTSGNVWIAGGMTSSTLNFEGHVLTSPLYSDALFLVEYDNSGNYVTGTTLHSGGDDWIGISVDNRGNVFIGADYETTTIVGTDTLSLVIPGEENMLIAKYCYANCSTLGATSEYAVPAGIEIFPNPAVSEVTVRKNGGFETGSMVELFDISGRQLEQHQLNGSEISFAVSDYPSGIYLCKIFTGGNFVTTRKLVITK